MDSNRVIALNYLLKWFVLDIITVLPLDLMFSLEDFTYKRLFKIPRMMRLVNTLFQNTESKKKTRGLVLDKLKSIFFIPKAYHIVTSLLVTVIFVHISACLWCLMLVVDENNWFLK